MDNPAKYCIILVVFAVPQLVVAQEKNEPDIIDR